MRDFIKGTAIITFIFAGLIGAIVATSRPAQTMDYARSTARSICSVSGTVQAACQELARLRPVKSGKAGTLRS